MTDSRWDILTGDGERDRRNVRILLESVEELYSPRAWDDVIRLALDRAILVTGAQRAIVLLESAGELDVQMARGADHKDLSLDQRYSRSVVDRVWTTGQPQLMVDAEDQGSTELGQSILDLRLLSIMATPLPVQGKNLGVLYVDSTVQAKEFTKADFAVYEALGGLVAIAIENGRLLEERAAKERMARELAVAREIQQRLFPTDIPNPSGFDIAAKGLPCEETSGDYYDAIPLTDGRIALIVGDVSGHGVPAAIFMTQTRALLHQLLFANPDPQDVIRGLNQSLERDMPPQTFMTLFLGVLDPEARTLTYVSAGHNPPYVVRRGGEVEELPSTGPLLGVLRGADFGISPPIALEQGDVVMLYTDGIFEAQDVDDTFWGENRFRKALVGHAERGDSAHGIIDGVVEDLFRFVRGRPLDDDLTALVVRAT